MKNIAIFACAVALCSGWLGSSQASAQTKGFAISRFDLSERGSEWFVGESLDLRGNQRWAAGLVLDYAHKPLVVYDAKGDETAAIVSDQLFANLGASVVFSDRVRVAANLPIALVTDGDRGTLGTATLSADSGASLGDARLGADVRLFGVHGDVITVAAGMQLYLPTGSREAFTGDGAIRLVPRALVAGELGAFAYSGRLALAFRAQDAKLGGVKTGSEILFAATAGLRFLDRKLLVGPELSGSTVLSAAFDRETTPFELLFGGHYTWRDFRFGVGVGPGLTEGLGSPALRLVESIEWAPGIAAPVRTPTPAPEAEAPSDRDHDGVLDAQDACPDVPGEASDDPQQNGCPVAQDRDHDGILDAQDACPDVPGERSSDPAKNGCPKPKDSDGDGIVDPEDACPSAAGLPNADPKKNGCPKARVESGKIMITERVEFATNSAKLLPSSDEILGAVLAVIKAHPDISKLSVEGHTDNRGGAAHNKTLSQNRAQAVLQWLVKHGVERNKLESKGFGLEQPIDTNDTEEGRQRNRRVEFKLVGLEGQAGKAQ